LLTRLEKVGRYSVETIFKVPSVTRSLASLMKRASIIFVVIVLAAAGLFVAYRSLHKSIAETFGGSSDHA
jgi:hypothetical protein